MRRQATYWRNLWRKNPAPLAANLAKINNYRKEVAVKRTEGILEIVAHIPDRIPSQDLKGWLSKGLEAENLEHDRKAVTKLLSNLRRRNLVRFDLDAMVWLVAKSP